jgi:hypothetical protein
MPTMQAGAEGFAPHGRRRAMTIFYELDEGWGGEIKDPPKPK